MNSLEELIQKYCPDGVEYVPLSAIGTIKRGNGLQKKDFVQSGVGCIHYGQIYTSFGTSAEKALTYVTEELASHLLHVEKGDLVIACTSENVEDVCKAVAWMGDDTIVTGGHSCVFQHNQNPKYIAYFFQTEDFQQQKRKYAYGTKVIDIKPDNLGKILIPLPPIPVQEEIVRVLDTFAELQTELQAELQAELQKRLQQYNYYRDNLLSFEGRTDVEWKMLGEVGTMYKGSGIQKKDFQESGFPCIHYGQIHTFYSTWTYETKSFVKPELARSKAKPGDLIIATTSEDVEACCKATAWLADNEVAVSGDATIFHHNQNPKYMSYLFQTEMFAKQKRMVATGVKVTRVSPASMLKFKFPFPSLKRQEEIVLILDKLNTLINNLSFGIPAEIKARQQQYEFYRDQLLTFKRAN